MKGGMEEEWRNGGERRRNGGGMEETPLRLRVVKKTDIGPKKRKKFQWGNGKKKKMGMTRWD